MIRFYEKRQQQLVELDRRTPGCWVNIAPPFNYEELEQLSTELQIPLDFLTDSLDIDERSRFEVEDDTTLIVLNTPILNDAAEQTAPLYITVPVGIILTPEHIVTIASYENAVLKRFLENRIKHFDTADHSLFVLRLLEQNVYLFLSYLKDINVRRNMIEQELHDSLRNREVWQMLSIDKSLVYFVTALSSNALLMAKMQRTDLLHIKHDEQKSEILSDVIIDNSQAQEMANIYTTILNGTMDAFTSIVSNNLNFVMQRLTLVTIVLMVPTLITGLFGMNVGLPFEGNPHAFWLIIALGGLISGSMIFFFRIRRLL